MERIPKVSILKSKLKSLGLSQTGTKQVLYERLFEYLIELKLVQLKKLAPKDVKKSQNKKDLIKDIILSEEDFVFEVVDGVKIIPVNDITEEKGSVKNNKQRTTIPKTLRAQVWKVYVGEFIETKCLICNNTMITAFDFDCSHITAHTNGGQTTIENLRPTCRSCNLSMATQNMESFCNQFFPNAPVLKTFEKNKCVRCHNKDRWYDNNKKAFSLYCSRTCRDKVY